MLPNADYTIISQGPTPSPLLKQMYYLVSSICVSDKLLITPKGLPDHFIAMFKLIIELCMYI